MRISVLQDQLARGLNIVSRAVDARPTLPVLANVLLATDESRLKLAATNLELTIITSIGAKVDRAGAITLPAKTFSELVNNLMPDRVDLNLDSATQTVNVRSGMTNSNVRGISAAEFPPLNETFTPDVVMPAKTFREMVLQTQFASAKDDARPTLTGIYTHLDKGVLTMAAADGFRLAVRTTRLENGSGKTDLIIPAKALNEVARIIGDEDKEISIALSGEQDRVMFLYENTLVATQVIDGKFPDFTAIIPKSYSTAVTLYTSDLLKACKRAEIFARDSNYSARLMVKPAPEPSTPGEVTVVGRSPERGDNEGVLDASVEGSSLEVAFNIRFLIDVLSVMNDEQVVLESNGAAHPGVIRPRDRDDFVCVVMPMSTTR
ncbi:MAG: DNA polymerase III subunit beta [Anaerolineae bacterium]|nr:DNA polymerase III subunit beta [Anaerolineae bacterium]NUQ05312.1 DNA polymerase III subunit beta [Anaerolineae bacterium]